jgi:cytidylate kinase
MMGLSNKDIPPLIVTIDGPAGAGKTTVSKQLARELGYRYIDTGALYRGIAVAARNSGVAVDDDTTLADLCRKISLDFVEKEGDLRLTLDQVDISDQIRTPEISMLASAISARPPVRRFLLDIQRAIGAGKRIVVEGRDMGTVVFPDAEVKFFLEADFQVRSRRRHTELVGRQGAPISLQNVEADMAKRDHDDSTRKIAPLKPASDAIRIDSSGLTIEQVVAAMLVHILKNVVAI